MKIKLVVSFFTIILFVITPCISSISIQNINCNKQADRIISNQSGKFLDGQNIKISDFGSPDFSFFEDIFCWKNSLDNHIHIIGAVVNTGDTYYQKDLHFSIAFFKEDSNRPYYIENEPMFNRDIWKKDTGEVFGSLAHTNDIGIDYIRVEIDYYNEIEETNEQNNIKNINIGPEVLVSGFVYNSENEPLSDIDVVNWAVECGSNWAGPFGTTDNSGYYKVSIPAKSPFDEKFSYKLNALGFVQYYENIFLSTEEVEAGVSTNLDFTLEQRTRLKFIRNFSFPGKINHILDKLFSFFN